MLTPRLAGQYDERGGPRRPSDVGGVNQMQWGRADVFEPIGSPEWRFMSAVDDANQRLEAALSRLEAALQQRVGAGAGDAGERQRLEAEMAAVRAQFAALQETSTAVSKRLDAAIGRLKGVLAE